MRNALLKVDADGVPKVVQFVTYNPGCMFWRFYLYHRGWVDLYEEQVPVQGIGLMTMRVTPEQEQDAMDWFEKRWETDECFRKSITDPVVAAA